MFLTTTLEIIIIVKKITFVPHYNTRKNYSCKENHIIPQYSTWNKIWSRKHPVLLFCWIRPLHNVWTCILFNLIGLSPYNDRFETMVREWGMQRILGITSWPLENHITHVTWHFHWVCIPSWERSSPNTPSNTSRLYESL